MAQQHSKAIHIIDAYFIESENMMIKNGKVVSLEER